MELFDQISSAGTSRLGPRTTRTPHPNYKHRLGPYLRVSEHPFQLAAQAGIDGDTSRPSFYGVARCCNAEDRNAGPGYWLAIAECVRNYAARKSTNPYAVITADIRRDIWGWFGQQPGRFISSAGGTEARPSDPHRGHGEAAIIALRDGSDFAGGAEKFFSPSGMGSLDAALNLLSKRATEGYQWVGQLESVDAKRFMALKFVGRDNADDGPAREFLLGVASPAEVASLGGARIMGADKAMEQLTVAGIGFTLKGV